MYRFISCLLILTSILYSQAWARNSFLVAPGRIDFNLTRPNTQSFIITNNGDDSIRISIEPLYLEIDSKSLAAGTHLNDEVAAKENLSSYLRVAPKRLSLKPGQRRDVRISLRPPPNLEEGDYRTHLLVRMLDTAHTLKSEADGEQSVGMELQIKMETAVAIYGHKGKKDPKLEISCGLDDETKYFELDIVNPSVWRFDGFIEVTTDSSTEPVFKDRLISLRESRKTLGSRWQPSTKGPFNIRLLDFESETEVSTSSCSIP